MKILILTPYLPYATIGHGGGAAVRDLIAYLARQHELLVVSLVRPGEEIHIAEVEELGVRVTALRYADRGVGGRGKVGVWAEELTREGIFKAVRARHTFGTSGAKMMLKFNSQTAMMGDKVTRPAGSIEFVIEALALRKIREMVVFRNNEIVFSVKPDTPEFGTRWTDKNPPKAKMLWYYVRVQAEDNELAWSSPIWFTVRR